MTYKQYKCFPHCCGGCKVQDLAQAALESSESLLPGLQTAPVCSVFRRQEGWRLSQALFMRAPSPSWGFHLHYLNNLPVVLFLNTAILRVKDFNTWILGRYKHSVYSSQQHSLYCICSSTHPPIDPYIHPPSQPFAHPSTHSHLFINWSLDFSLFLYSSE